MRRVCWATAIGVLMLLSCDKGDGAAKGEEKPAGVSAPTGAAHTPCIISMRESLPEITLVFGKDTRSDDEGHLVPADPNGSMFAFKPFRHTTTVGTAYGVLVTYDELGYDQQERKWTRKKKALSLGEREVLDLAKAIEIFHAVRPPQTQPSVELTELRMDYGDFSLYGRVGEESHAFGGLKVDLGALQKALEEQYARIQEFKKVKPATELK